MKIKDDYDLENLIIKYGFRKNKIIEHNVYIYDLERTPNIACSILVNTAEVNDRKIRFYYYDDLEDKINFYYHDGKINEFTTEPVDYVAEIPDVIFKMIQNNIVEI